MSATNVNIINGQATKTDSSRPIPTGRPSITALINRWELKAGRQQTSLTGHGGDVTNSSDTMTNMSLSGSNLGTVSGNGPLGISTNYKQSYSNRLSTVSVNSSGQSQVQPLMRRTSHSGTTTFNTGSMSVQFPMPQFKSFSDLSNSQQSQQQQWQNYSTVVTESDDSATATAAANSNGIPNLRMTTSSSATNSMSTTMSMSNFQQLQRGVSQPGPGPQQQQLLQMNPSMGNLLQVTKSNPGPSRTSIQGRASVGVLPPHHHVNVRPQHGTSFVPLNVNSSVSSYSAVNSSNCSPVERQQLNSTANNDLNQYSESEVFDRPRPNVNMIHLPGSQSSIDLDQDNDNLNFKSYSSESHPDSDNFNLNNYLSKTMSSTMTMPMPSPSPTQISSTTINTGPPKQFLRKPQRGNESTNNRSNTSLSQSSNTNQNQNYSSNINTILSGNLGGSLSYIPKGRHTHTGSQESRRQAGTPNQNHHQNRLIDLDRDHQCQSEVGPQPCQLQAVDSQSNFNLPSPIKIKNQSQTYTPSQSQTRAKSQNSESRSQSDNEGIIVNNIGQNRNSFTNNLSEPNNSNSTGRISVTELNNNNFKSQTQSRQSPSEDQQLQDCVSHSANSVWDDAADQSVKDKVLSDPTVTTTNHSSDSVTLQHDRDRWRSQATQLQQQVDNLQQDALKSAKKYTELEESVQVYAQLLKRAKNSLGSFEDSNSSNLQLNFNTVTESQSSKSQSDSTDPNRTLVGSLREVRSLQEGFREELDRLRKENEEAHSLRIQATQRDVLNADRITVLDQKITTLNSIIDDKDATIQTLSEDNQSHQEHINQLELRLKELQDEHNSKLEEEKRDSMREQSRLEMEVNSSISKNQKSEQKIYDLKRELDAVKRHLHESNAKQKKYYHAAVKLYEKLPPDTSSAADPDVSQLLQEIQCDSNSNFQFNSDQSFNQTTTTITNGVATVVGTPRTNDTDDTSHMSSQQINQNSQTQNPNETIGGSVSSTNSGKKGITGWIGGLISSNKSPNKKEKKKSSESFSPAPRVNGSTEPVRGRETFQENVNTDTPNLDKSGSTPDDNMIDNDYSGQQESQSSDQYELVQQIQQYKDREKESRQTMNKLYLEIDGLKNQVETIRLDNDDFVAVKEALIAEQKVTAELKAKHNASKFNEPNLKEENDELMRLYTREKEKNQNFEKDEKKAKRELEEAKSEVRKARESEQDAQARVNQLMDETRRAHERINELVIEMETLKSENSLRARTSESNHVHFLNRNSQSKGTNSSSQGHQQLSLDNLSLSQSQDELNHSNNNLARQTSGRGSPQAAGSGSGSSRNIAKIQSEKEKLKQDLERLDREETAAQAVADKEQYLGNSLWLRDCTTTSSTSGPGIGQQQGTNSNLNSSKGPGMSGLQSGSSAIQSGMNGTNTSNLVESGSIMSASPQQNSNQSNLQQGPTGHHFKCTNLLENNETMTSPTDSPRGGGSLPGHLGAGTLNNGKARQTTLAVPRNNNLNGRSNNMNFDSLQPSESTMLGIGFTASPRDNVNSQTGKNSDHSSTNHSRGSTSIVVDTSQQNNSSNLAARATVQNDGKTPNTALTNLQREIVRGGGLSSLPPHQQANDTPEMQDKRKRAFRSVGRDDTTELESALENVECYQWITWVNGAGDSLIKMADNRKREKSLHWLRKRMGVTELTTNERGFLVGDNVWVFRQLGDPQPEQATVKEVLRILNNDNSLGSEFETEPYYKESPDINEVQAASSDQDQLLGLEYWDSKTKNEYIPAVRCRLMLRNSWEAE